MIPTKALAPHRTETRVAAFFDVDNTLLPGEASEVRFFRTLWRRGVVSWSELRESAWWLLRQVPPLSLQPLRERKVYLAGKPVQVIEPLGEEFCREELCPGVAADGLRRMEEHRQAGHVIILITGSLDFLIEPIASALRVDRCIAVTLEARHGLYTGHLSSPLPYGEGKRRLIQQLASELDLDLRTCFAYGDSPGDREILECVGNPTVVNPIRGMARIAKRKGWPIQQWR
jgi:HAD superfamily hydrolase (TIGR01490 family)